MAISRSGSSSSLCEPLEPVGGLSPQPSMPTLAPEAVTKKYVLMLVAGGLNKGAHGLKLPVETDSLDGLKVAVREKLGANADQQPQVRQLQGVHRRPVHHVRWRRRERPPVRDCDGLRLHIAVAEGRQDGDEQLRLPADQHVPAGQAHGGGQDDDVRSDVRRVRGRVLVQV